MDRQVRVWDVETGQLRALLSGHSREVLGVAFTPDGQTLISAAAPEKSLPHWVKGGEVKLWTTRRVESGDLYEPLERDFDARNGPVFRAHSLRERGDWEGALAAYTAWLSADPDNPVPWAHRGAVHHRLGRLPEFVADFREQVREVEINPLAVLERGVCALDCVIVPREEASS